MLHRRINATKIVYATQTSTLKSSASENPVYFYFMKTESVVVLFGIICLSCSQTKTDTKSSTAKNVQIGGGCEGCEAIYDMPGLLSSTDTLPDWSSPGIKIEVSGVIFQSDGETPAPDVVLYIYHTDTSGHYSSSENAKGFWKTHGFIRGWVKTNVHGWYKFYTKRPVSYPNSIEPAHIHPVIKEPDKNEYYIDAYVFEDDPLLTSTEKSKLQNRGGSGIVHPTQMSNGIWVCRRDIVLGKNIPDYPSGK